MVNESEEDKERERGTFLFCRGSHLCGTVVEAQYYVQQKRGEERGSKPSTFAVIVIPTETLQELRM